MLDRVKTQTWLLAGMGCVLAVLLFYRLIAAERPPRAAFASPASSYAADHAGVDSGQSETQSGGQGDAPSIDARGTVLSVDVEGEVANPGVYRLKAGARAAEAVQSAGGFTKNADRFAFNGAAMVEDGGTVRVPAKGASSFANESNDAPTPRKTPAHPVNVNAAGAQELETLPGVGPSRARAILAYRQKNGVFANVDDLAHVPGIGPKRLAALRPWIRLQ